MERRVDPRRFSPNADIPTGRRCYQSHRILTLCAPAATSSYPATQEVNSSGQPVEQRPGVPQDRRVEPFGERAIHQREEVVSFRALALVAP